jgi:hypothetical protein
MARALRQPDALAIQRYFLLIRNSGIFDRFPRPDRMIPRFELDDEGIGSS